MSETFAIKEDENDSPLSAALSPPEDIIADIAAGKMVVLVDDEDRENEGDLVIAAEHADADAINFMATHGRGLICLAMTGERINQLQLSMMAADNKAPLQTAFTVSIEAREGVTTGISAADRAKTVQVAIDPKMGASDLVVPGHVFPLAARDGGVLVRAGHTEAAVDLSRLGGLNPSGVICEIMNDDGTMARLSDLVGFCETHDLKLGTIADLIAYRLKNDTIVERKVETRITHNVGCEFDLTVFENAFNGTEHVALTLGEWTEDDPVLVRMHALNIVEDVFHDAQSERADELEMALTLIAEEGRGALVLIQDSWNSRFSTQIKMRQQASEGIGAQHENDKPVLRDYGVGAQILRELGISRLRLLTNTKESSIKGIDGYGLSIVERVAIPRKSVSS
ncbi:MAG: 3,4-dihydroxy-2-butanone-4-phosphate synthase [Rhodospirillaceae bacterium]